MKLENTNDLVYEIAKRVKVLGDMTMRELRSTNGYGCDTEWESQQKDKGKTRGEVLEEILCEEFVEECPPSIVYDNG